MKKLVLFAFLFAAAACCAQTYTESVLYSFPFTDAGVDPTNLVMDSAGNIYGAETTGGPNDNCEEGPCGAIFKLSASGVFSTIYPFSGRSGGFGPLFLVINKSGDLYGTTYGGNPGIVFEFAPKTKTYSILHRFGLSPKDGAYLSGTLTLDSSGNLFGTTYDGGANDDGTVFEITPKGAEKVLYSFTSGPIDGSYAGNVLRNQKGDIYGVVSNLNGGPGYLYELTSSGVQSVLNGSLPSSASSLSRSAAGNFYGVAGTELWKVLGSDYELSEYTFASLTGLTGPLAFSNGNIYGTAFGGGTNGAGGVYEYNESTGTETTLYNFCSLPNCADGTTPGFGSGLIADSKGNLYGTTLGGGKHNGGTIFKLTKN
jgi:uncharacterized repeat protein (TIGR03803 family)